MSASSENRRLLWDVVFGICVVVTVVATVIKLSSGDIKFSVDFPTLLSLLLALFSVWLSALFYFKATESSNSFYDNTYKFTADVSQLLTRMDTGLGEKLALLESRYSDLKEYMRSGYGATDRDSSVTDEQIDQEKAELEKVVSEKDIIIARLIESSSLEDAEKEKIRVELEEKNNKIKDLLDEVEALSGRQNFEQAHEAAKIFSLDDEDESHQKILKRVSRYTKTTALKRLTADPEEILSFRKFSSLFFERSKYLNNAYVKDLEALGFTNGGFLTRKGYDFFVSMYL
ncbi:hypothetical protein [Pseudomonas sp.]|uniref:hypothetical protein n=1 Tax=Pseudomonas sp. TaxID=306 RepID=UPI0033407DC1